MSNRTRAWIIGVVVVLAIAAAVAWSYTRTPEPFPPSSADHLTSWALPLAQDAASSTPRMTAQISQLSAMLGGGAYPNEDIYIGMANDYTLLGDGKSAFDFYEKAIAASSSDALAYDDLGGLFARLYATTSAERAYTQAVTLDPGQVLFQLSYLDYLAEVAPSAPATAEAFAQAKQILGSTNLNVLVAEANWLSQIGSTTAAINDWRAVEAQEPTAAASIQARITQLQQ